MDRLSAAGDGEQLGQELSHFSPRGCGRRIPIAQIRDLSKKAIELCFFDASTVIWIGEGENSLVPGLRLGQSRFSRADHDTDRLLPGQVTVEIEAAIGVAEDDAVLRGQILVTGMPALSVGARRSPIPLVARDRASVRAKTSV